MLIVSGTASTAFGKALSSEMGCALADTEIIRFPDGECYVRIDTPLGGEDVVVVQNTYPDPNIVENLLLQDAVSEAKPSSFTVVIPYFGYSRQDKAFKPGEGMRDPEEEKETASTEPTDADDAETAAEETETEETETEETESEQDKTAEIDMDDEPGDGADDTDTIDDDEVDDADGEIA